MNFPSWHSYPSIYALGHRAIADLLTVPVNVEEKVDGSQFSFGVDLDGELHARSKGAKLHVDAPEKMFSRAIDAAKMLAGNVERGWTYRCEYLQKPKHNTLAYDRVPRHNLILFDVNTAEESYLTRAEKEREAERMGMECVPLIYSGRVRGMEQFREFLDRVSILGGQKIEGVVVKPIGYGMYGADKKALLGKFVSESFKEIHGVEWKKENPSGGDVVQILAASLKTPARWGKAVQHMAESGTLENSPRDIGKLIKEVQGDIEKECVEEIKDALYQWAWPQLRRLVTRGLPEWYKEELLKQALNESAVAPCDTISSEGVSQK